MARSYAKRKKERSPQQEDIFVDRFLQATAWAQENLTVVVLATVILGLGVAGILYYRSYRASVTEQAAVELQRLGGVVGNLDPATATDTLRGFVVRYDGTASADEARILLGRVQLQAGRADGAAETLEPVTRHPADTPLGYAARTLLAAAHEACDDADAALQTYAELGREARLAFQRRRALADRARLLLETGRFQEAADLYGELAERAEEADAPGEAASYRIRFGEARAQAAGAPSDPASSPAADPAGDPTSTDAGG